DEVPVIRSQLDLQSSHCAGAVHTFDGSYLIELALVRAKLGRRVWLESLASRRRYGVPRPWRYHFRGMLPASVSWWQSRIGPVPFSTRGLAFLLNRRLFSKFLGVSASPSFLLLLLLLPVLFVDF
ncbi:hypothetical protein GW17_00017214, partial [Ensete ventricosum]